MPTLLLPFTQILAVGRTPSLSEAIAFISRLVSGWEFWLFLATCAGFFLSWSSIWHVGRHKFVPQRFRMGIALILLVVGFGISVVKAPPTSGKTEEETREKPISVASMLKEILDESLYAHDYPGWAIAKELAQCSSDVYLPHVEAEEILKKRGYKSVSPLNTSTMVCYVAMLDDTAVKRTLAEGATHQSSGRLVRSCKVFQDRVDRLRLDFREPQLGHASFPVARCASGRSAL